MSKPKEQKYYSPQNAALSCKQGYHFLVACDMFQSKQRRDLLQLCCGFHPHPLLPTHLVSQTSSFFSLSVQISFT